LNKIIFLLLPFKDVFFVTMKRRYINTGILIYYRITVVMKVVTDIIASIAWSLIGQTVILVMMYVEIFKNDVLVFFYP
jgi:hypothetical protein